MRTHSLGLNIDFSRHIIGLNYLWGPVTEQFYRNNKKRQLCCVTATYLSGTPWPFYGARRVMSHGVICHAHVMMDDNVTLHSMWINRIQKTLWWKVVLYLYLQDVFNLFTKARWIHTFNLYFNWIRWIRVYSVLVFNNLCYLSIWKKITKESMTLQIYSSSYLM